MVKENFVKSSKSLKILLIVDSRVVQELRALSTLRPMMMMMLFEIWISYPVSIWVISPPLKRK